MITDAHRRYLARETVGSAVINAVLSFGVCWLVFGRGGAASVEDARAFATDFLPQAFILSLMSTLVPGAVTRRRIKLGQVAPLIGMESRWPRSLPCRAVLIAFVAACIGGGAALLLTLLAWPGSLSLASVYVIKVLFGVLLSIPVTRIGLKAALSDRAG